DATSGDADNSSSVSATVMFDNSGSTAAVSEAVAGIGGGGGSATALIENTGAFSENEVEYESDVRIDVDNRNYVDINNTVSQTATSGDAKVKFNTTGGDATSGSVSNTSTSNFTVEVTN